MKKLMVISGIILLTGSIIFGQEEKKTEEKKTTAKKLYILNIQQGEIFNDIADSVDVSLSEEYAVKEKGMS